jgi:hypothetical protein
LWAWIGFGLVMPKFKKLGLIFDLAWLDIFFGLI